MQALLVCLLLAGLAMGQDAYKVGDGVSAPVPIYKVEPAYSPEARAARVEGTVLLALVIDDQGVPEHVEVLKTNLRNKDTEAEEASDHGLGVKAVEAVLKWRFKPGQKDGKPVRVKANVEFNFRLN